jgi:hypothetical protein
MFPKKPLSETELLQIIEDMSDIDALSDDGENMMTMKTPLIMKNVLGMNHLMAKKRSCRKIM